MKAKLLLNFFWLVSALASSPAGNPTTQPPPVTTPPTACNPSVQPPPVTFPPTAGNPSVQPPPVTFPPTAGNPSVQPPPVTFPPTAGNPSVQPPPVTFPPTAGNPSVQPPPVTFPPTAAFSCNFDENLCGFYQDNDDKFDWIRHTGSTRSGGTGPNRDHTSGNGYYVYIEASSPRDAGDNAKISRMVTLSGKSCLRFYYHMYGNNMGTLKVKLSGQVIFSKSEDQGNKWHMKQIGLTGKGARKLTFEGIRGSSFKGDAAIDDIVIFDC